MKVSFNHTKLKAIKYKKQIIRQVRKVLDQGIFLNGQNSKKTEEFLKNYFKTNYFLTCASGHDALLLALQSLNLKHDDEVIFPVNAYPTAFPIFINGSKGVPSDVDDNGQLDPDEVIKLINSKTKVIIAVHLYGLVGSLEKIVEICKKNKILLIEDCAQAFGSKYKNKLVGTFGDIGCFSFYPTKNIGALGDGGGILTSNKRIYDYLSKAVQYGEKYRYQSEFISGHSRLPEIQASIFNLYLKNINKEFQQRIYLKNYYEKQIIKHKLDKYIYVLSSDEKSEPVNHLFVIKVKLRDRLRIYLKKANIETLIHYPLTVNKVSAFDFLSKKNYPNAETLSKEILSLPFHPYLEKKQIDYIIKKIVKFYEKNND